MFSALRQTFRRLIRETGFTTTVLLTLALCIGANITIFAVVDAILVRPLPYPEPARLVTLHNSYPRAGATRVGASETNYYDRRHAIKALASISIFQNSSTIVGREGSPNRVSMARVSPEFFTTLGVPLARGHMFSDHEMDFGADQVAVLTDEYWRNHFNSDPNIIGRKFYNDGLAITIIGVLPRGFRYPSSKAQFYRPASHGKDDIGPSSRHSNNYLMIARLAPARPEQGRRGATLADARAQIDAFNQQQLNDDPYAQSVRDAGYTTHIDIWHADIVRDIRPLLLMLEAGVLTLLLIGSFNLINLLLIRANGRAKEFAVRQALGAARRHVIRETVLETVLLSLGGGLIGLLLGAFGVDLLARLGTDQLPLGGEVVLDARVSIIALLATLVVGVLLALPIVFSNLRFRLAPVLHTESRTGTVSRAAQRVRHAFIVAQIFLAFVLLTSAGLLAASLEKVLSVPPGFHPNHVLTGTISLPWKTYPKSAEKLAFLERLYAALKAQPGVTAVGFSSGLPFSGSVSNNATTVEGVEPAPGESIRTHYTSFALGDYWKALGIPLVEGRLLEPGDNSSKQRVCVVDTEFARRYWPGQSALGHRITNGPQFDEDRAATIVGVVGNVKQSDLADTNALGAIYYPHSIYSVRGFSVVIRTPMAPAALSAALRKTVLTIDPSLPVDSIRPMQTLMDDSLVARRSPAVLASAFAAVALLLAAVGTYGVLAYAVSQRRREIGVRMALGALPRQILTQFLGLGAKLLLIGIGLGLIGAWLAGRAMQSMLFGIGAINPWVLVVAVATITIVVLFAIFLPSRRATKVDPMEALRTE